MSFSSNIAQGFGGQGNLPPNVSMGFGMPPANATGGWQGAVNEVANQTQQMANNPIYGEQSPFQPPQSNSGLPPNVGLGGGPADLNNMGFGKFGFGNGGMIPGMINGGTPNWYPNSGGGQLAGGPAGQPILGGTPMAGTPNIVTNPFAGPTVQPGPMTTQARPAQVPQSTYGRVSNNKPQQPIYRGGLRQAPNNYRPPMGRFR